MMTVLDNSGYLVSSEHVILDIQPEGFHDESAIKKYRELISFEFGRDGLILTNGPILCRLKQLEQKASQQCSCRGKCLRGICPATVQAYSKTLSLEM